MAKPKDSKPIALSPQEGGDIEEAAGIVFLGDTVTGTRHDDDDIRAALTAVGAAPSPENVAKVKAELKQA